MFEIRYETKSRLMDPAAERERRIAVYAKQLGHTGRKVRFRFGGVFAKPVRCIDTGVEYASTGTAATALGINAQNLRAALRDGRRAVGLRFEYIPGVPAALLLSCRSRAVVCITTKQVFESISAAARQHEVPISSLFDAVRTGKPCRGRAYAYAMVAEAA